MAEHLIDGEFQSDKYPTTPRGKVPLSCKDPTAQDLLWEYAQRRRVVDAAFSDDLETALRDAGYQPTPGGGEREAFEAWARQHVIFDLHRHPEGNYIKATAHIAFEAWQAARLAPAVTLTSKAVIKIFHEHLRIRQLIEEGVLDQPDIITGAIITDESMNKAAAAIIDRITGAKAMTARLAALPKDWDRDPMPGSVRELVRDLLRMTEKEGAK